MMKKLLITLTALASFSLMNAQEDSIRFGAKAGLNISNITGDDSGDENSKIGFHIGALAEIPVSEVFAIQPEILFSTQGSKSEEDDVEATTKLNYINIPVIAKYYVAEGFSIQAGPQIGFLTSADVKVEFAGEEEEVDVKEFLKSTDFNLVLGAGYQLESGVFFDARYNLGLSNISEDDDSDLKNSVFQISLGYKF